MPTQRNKQRFLPLLVIFGLLLSGCPARMSDVEKYSRDGVDYLNNGSYAEAEAAFEKALRLSPGEAGILMNRGNARMMQEKYDAALADYDAALAIDAQFAMAYANRGMLRDRLGDAPGAIADYRRALELDPDLGKGPSVWKRVISNAPTDTISGRMHYLEFLQRGEQPPAQSAGDGR